MPMKAIVLATLILVLLPVVLAATTGQLIASPGQLFWVNGSWVPAGQLHPGDKFTTPDGQVGIVKTIQNVVLPENASCFSLSTSRPHDFFANNMLARDVSRTAGPTLHAVDPAEPQSPIQLVLSKLRDFISRF